MSEGHASLRDDYDSSCAEADALVELALTSGAHGARLVGAGWGGAVIALAPPAREARMLVEVAEGFERRFGRMPVMWATRAAGGLRREPASDQINRGRPTRHA
jgi:galactokinase